MCCLGEVEQPVQAPDTMWKHDMFTDQMAGYSAPGGRASAIETGTKLYISNLEYGVSNEDIKVGFGFFSFFALCAMFVIVISNCKLMDAFYFLFFRFGKTLFRIWLKFS